MNRISSPSQISLTHVLVTSQYSNTKGVYEVQEEPTNGAPSYRCAESGTYLFNHKDAWVFSSELSTGKVLASSEPCPSAQLPWLVPDEAWLEGKVQSVRQMLRHSNAVLPKALRLDSEFNIRGGYRLLPETQLNGHAVYHNEDAPCYLWYNPLSAGGAWIISSELGSSASYCTAPAEQSVNNPLMVPAHAWSENLVALVEEVPHDIEAEEREDAGKFVDEEFRADTLTNGLLGEAADALAPEKVNWIRASRLRRDERLPLFCSEMMAQVHVLEGHQLQRNAYLLATVAAIPNYEECLRNAFYNCDNGADEGRYGVELYDPAARAEETFTVTVDDLIPCKTRGWWETTARPLFVPLDLCQLWPHILEKALAKHLGTFTDAEWSNLPGVVQLLTGTKEPLVLRKDEGKWMKLRLNAKQQRKMINAGEVKAQPLYTPRVCGNMKTKELLKNLCKLNHDKYWVTGRMQGQEKGESKLTSRGLVFGHAYRVHQVMQTKTKEGENVSLVALNNPWGKSREWNKAWSRNDEAWKNMPKIKDFDRDDLFWMPFEDFVCEFDEIIIFRHANRVGKGCCGGCCK